MKEIKTKDKDIHIYGTNTTSGNVVIKIDEVSLNKLDMDVTSIYELVVMKYQDKYVVFTDFFVSSVTGNNTCANITCEYDKELWFEKRPDEEELALEMI